MGGINQSKKVDMGKELHSETLNFRHLQGWFMPCQSLLCNEHIFTALIVFGVTHYWVPNDSQDTLSSVSRYLLVFTKIFFLIRVLQTEYLLRKILTPLLLSTLC